MSFVTVTVPATTANLGPGFDCIGASVTLYNQFKFAPAPDMDLKITVTGTEATRVVTDQSNLAYKSFLKLYQHLGQTAPKVEIEIQLGIPLARGLGSSASAIVGGLVGANCLAGNPLNTSEIMELAIAIEGHPDNVVPALLGNCQLCVGEMGNWQICQIPWHETIIPIVAIPDFELSTEQARAVVPKQLSRTDAIYNISRFGLLLRGLETGKADWLRMALDDKLHQPYRQNLIKGYESVKTAAMEAGAYGMVISGAGPTLLALTPPHQVESVRIAMGKAWEAQGIVSQVKALSLATQGTIWETIES